MFQEAQYQNVFDFTKRPPSADVGCRINDWAWSLNSKVRVSAHRCRACVARAAINIRVKIYPKSIYVNTSHLHERPMGARVAL